MKLGLCGQLFKNTQISSFIKICPVGVELFRADGRTRRHDEANSHFTKFCARAENPKKKLRSLATENIVWNKTNTQIDRKQKHVCSPLRLNMVQN